MGDEEMGGRVNEEEYNAYNTREPKQSKALIIVDGTRIRLAQRFNDQVKCYQTKNPK